MPEFTEADVTRLTGMLRVPIVPSGGSTAHDLARRLLEQGVTLPPPPPDPAVVVAEALRATWYGDTAAPFAPESYSLHARMVDAVRDLFTPEALAQAAAKVQEADRG